jgi:hypothetical protein
MERPQIYPDQMENAEEEGYTFSFPVTGLHQQAAHLFPQQTISTPYSAFGFHELPAADNGYFVHPDGDHVSARYISASASPSAEDEYDDVRSLEGIIAFGNWFTRNHQVSDQTLSASPAAVPMAMDDDILFKNFASEENFQWATDDRRSSEASLDSSYSYDPSTLLQQGSGPSCYVPWKHPMVQRPQEIRSLGNSPTGGLVAIQNGEILTNASQLASLQGVREIVHASASSLPLSLPNLTNQDMKSSQMVWSLSSGEPVEEKSSRKRPPAQRAQSMAIRRSGGQCETCRNQKRKVCGPTNLARVMLSYGLVFPGSSWKRTFPSLQAFTSASGHSTQSFLRVDSFDFLDLISILHLVVPGHWTR